MELVSVGHLNQLLLREDSPRLHHYQKLTTRSGTEASPVETLLETLALPLIILFLQVFLQFLGLLGMYNPIYVQSPIFQLPRK